MTAPAAFISLLRSGSYFIFKHPVSSGLRIQETTLLGGMEKRTRNRPLPPSQASARDDPMEWPFHHPQRTQYRAYSRGESCTSEVGQGTIITVEGKGLKPGLKWLSRVRHQRTPG